MDPQIQFFENFQEFLVFGKYFFCFGITASLFYCIQAAIRLSDEIKIERKKKSE